jgi:NAD(P) transhydrogenase subunit alpha
MDTNQKQAVVGLAGEHVPGERRVALIPADIQRLRSKAVFRVEAGAGLHAGYHDADYAAAGATIVETGALASGVDVLVKIRPPRNLIPMRPGTVLISLGGRDAELAPLLKAHGIVHLGLERLPRITRAQSMDVLSSQAAIAGYAAVIEGARALDRLLPMLTTAAGIIKPARMIALGAGVAGLQALATARRLGAITHGFDVREAAREQVESIGAKFVFPDVPLAAADGSGGYAAEQSADQQVLLRRALAEPLSTMHLVVTSAQIPGKPAPALIDERTLEAMQPGSVIVDLAAETGGNTTLTRAGETVEVNGIRIIGGTQLPSIFARDASQLFSGNVRALLEHLLNDGGLLRLDAEDAITQALLAGQSIDEALAVSAEV